MIFLSAQPDTQYFIWQLEVQLSNFKKFGVKAKDIHVLVAYESGKGVNHRFLTFSAENQSLASFFFYPDLREKKAYLSSIRPNVIKQHFKQFPELCTEAIFYHDSDIIFTTELPDFDRLCVGDTWYFSNTTSYLDSKYISSKGELVLNEMCRALDIDPKLVIENDENAGGAQAVLKNVDFEFWNKVEHDCEKLYSLLYNSTKRYTEEFVRLTNKSKEDYVPISSWCADMWALLWNGFKHSTIKIDKELDFCWPNYDRELWSSNKIFHNAGVNHLQSDKYFYKGDYVDKDPYDTDFSFVSNSFCSYYYVEEINRISENQFYNIIDATVLISVNSNIEKNIEYTRIAVNFLKKYFNVNILLLEIGEKRKLFEQDMPAEVTCSYVFDKETDLGQAKYTNFLIKMAKTEIVIVYDYQFIVPPAQLYNAVLSVRYNRKQLCYPYNGSVNFVKNALKACFSRELDVRIFSRYTTTALNFSLSYNHCFISDRNVLIDMGLMNEEFDSVELRFKELYKRFKILGYTVSNHNGCIYGLEEEKQKYISQADEHIKCAEYTKYLRICNTKQKTLKDQVSKFNKNQVL